MDTLEIARACALKSSMKTRYGCVILHRNKIIATGYNRHTIHRSKLNSCVL